MIARKQLTLLVPVVLLLSSGLSGCATIQHRNPRDPWEGYNRAVFTFNENLDRIVIKPVAKGYKAVVPAPVSTLITNFFSNIGDIMVSVNNLLQGKVREAASDLGRVALNSTLGVGGLLDVATDMTFEKHDEDFGQTFARWGAGNGPYFVLPVIGPSTIRDTFGLAADWESDPMTYVRPYHVRDTMNGVRFLDYRSDLLDAEKVVEAGAIDKYSYVRDAYFQHREYLIFDGNPPRVEEEYEQ